MEGPYRTSPFNLAVATGQISTLLNAGLPLTTALSTVVELTPCKQLARVMADVLARVSAGTYLSNAMRRHPLVFSRSYVALITAGESSGQLPNNLRRCADWLEQDEQVLRRLKAAAVYPALVVVVAVTLTLVLFTSFLPKLFEMFASSGTPLPWLTRMMMLFTWLFTRLWFWLAVPIAAAGLWRLTQRPGFAEQAQRFVRDLPVVGTAVQMITLVRFAQCLSSLLECGLPLLHSWTIAAESSGDLVLAADAPRITQALKHGTTLAVAVGEGTVYPKSMSGWIEMGERTASMPTMLNRMAQIYKMEAEVRLDSLGAMLEPLFIATMGGFVMLVLVSIMLPIYGNLMQLS